MGFTNEELKKSLQAVVKDANSGNVQKIVTLQHQEIGTPQIPKNLTTYGTSFFVDAVASGNTTTLKNAYVSGALFVGAGAIITGSSTTTGNNTTLGSMYVTGTSVFASDVVITGSSTSTRHSTVLGNLYVTGTSMFSAGASVTGSTIFSGSVVVTGSTICSGSVTITGTFDVNTGVNQALIATAGNVGVGTQAISPGGGTGVLFLGNATVTPTTNPSNGVIVYGQSGQLISRVPNGTTLRIGQISQRLNTTYTSTSTQLGTTTLTFAVDASTIWRLEYRGSAKSSVANGFSYVISAPTGSLVEGHLLSYLGYGGTPNLTTLEFTQPNTPVGTVHVSNANVLGPDTISATVSVGGSSGNIAISVQNAIASTTTILSGAFLVAHLMDSV